MGYEKNNRLWHWIQRWESVLKAVHITLLVIALLVAGIVAVDGYMTARVLQQEALQTIIRARLPDVEGSVESLEQSFNTMQTMMVREPRIDSLERIVQNHRETIQVLKTTQQYFSRQFEQVYHWVEDLHQAQIQQ